VLRAAESTTGADMQRKSLIGKGRTAPEKARRQMTVKLSAYGGKALLRSLQSEVAALYFGVKSGAI